MSDHNRTWSEQEAQAIVRQFEAAQPPERVLQKRQLILDRLLPSIREKRKQGWTYREIQDQLAQLGVTISVKSLSAYTRQATKRSSGPKIKAVSTLEHEPTAPTPSDHAWSPDPSVTATRSASPLGGRRQQRFTEVLKGDV